MMTNTLAARLALRDRFRACLTQLCAERGPGDTPDQREQRERAGMLAEVNRARAEQGKPPVGMAEVAKADRLATGHVDWFDKFSLYCAELVMAP